jgi:hypothetical protein
MSDIYYAPEEHGVTLLGYVDLGQYEWCALGVFQRDSDGAILYATDSGCSCYGFLDGEGVDALTPLGAGYAEEWRRWYRENAANYGEFSDERDALEKLVRQVGQILSDQRRANLRKS